MKSNWDKPWGIKITPGESIELLARGDDGKNYRLLLCGDIYGNAMVVKREKLDKMPAVVFKKKKHEKV